MSFSDAEHYDTCGLGEVRRTWTATDCAGNSASHVQTIAVFDRTPPELQAPADASFVCVMGQLGLDLAMDSCGSAADVVVSLDDSHLYADGSGVIVLTLTAPATLGSTSSRASAPA